MRRRHLLLGLLLLAMPGAGRSDVFVLRNGTKIDGYSQGKSPSGEQVIGTAAGVRRVAAAVLAEVQPSADAAKDFEAYFRGLPKKDADAAAFLGAWAKERGLPEAARKAFQRALELRPDQALAREGLGFVKFGGEWVTPEEAERRRREEAAREAVAGPLEKSLGARPEVQLTPHWRHATFLADGKAAERAANLEKAFAAAAEVLGSDPWRDRALAVECAGADMYHRWIQSEGARLPGMRGPFLEGVKKSTGLKWNEPPTLVRHEVPSTAAMHAAFLHTAGHLLVNLWGGLNREQPFWVEEGFGGWIEERIVATRSSYCWGILVKKPGYGTLGRGGGDPKAWDVDDPDWKGLAKGAAERNEFLPLDQMDALLPGEYSRREVGQAFSFVSFLLKEQDHARFRDYLRRVKAGTKSPAAFRQAYGKTLEEIEPDWKRFVAAGW